MNTVVIKIGGSVITDKSRKFSLKRDVLQSISEVLSSVEDRIVLVHGGGSFGHPVAAEYDISSGYSYYDQLRGFSETHRAMERLNSEVIDSLLEAGCFAIPMQTSASIIVDNGEISSMQIKTVDKALEMGFLPVLYGDSVFDLSKGMTILSGDQLVAYLAKGIDADKVVFGVDVDGVFTSDPKKDKDAEFISEITPESWKNISKKINFSPSEDVTGEMKNKIEALLGLAEAGVDSLIVNATKPEVLMNAIRSDKEVGTKITRKG